MDIQAITDLLLQSAQELAQKGQTLAEEKLQLPESGPERDKALETLGKGAAAGGLLVALLGTGAGRKLTGTTLKLGSLAALGAVAYQAYQSWLGKTEPPGTPVNQLHGPAAATRSLALLKAAIAAARADGHLDDTERARIEAQLGTLDLDPDSLALFKAELEKPLSAGDVAAAADSPAAAAEMYLISLAVIDEQSEQERAYLRSLASELKLSSELVAALESGAETA